MMKRRIRPWPLVASAWLAAGGLLVVQPGCGDGADGNPSRESISAPRKGADASNTAVAGKTEKDKKAAAKEAAATSKGRLGGT